MKLVALKTNVFQCNKTTDFDRKHASEVVLLEIERSEAREIANGRRQHATQQFVLFNTQEGQSREPSEVRGNERAGEVETLKRQIINDRFVLTAAKERIQRTGRLAHRRVDAAVVRRTRLVGELCAQHTWTSAVARCTSSRDQQSCQCRELSRGRRAPRRSDQQREKKEIHRSPSSGFGFNQCAVTITMTLLVFSLFILYREHEQCIQM